MFLSYQNYLEWHNERYGQKPKANMLLKYYPNEYREEDVEQEEKLQVKNPIHVDMKFGFETEG